MYLNSKQAGHVIWILDGIVLPVLVFYPNGSAAASLVRSVVRVDSKRTCIIEASVSALNITRDDEYVGTHRRAFVLVSHVEVALNGITLLEMVRLDQICRYRSLLQWYNE